MEKRYLLLALQVVWQKGKLWLFSIGLFTILTGIQPLLLLWLTKELINEITRLISSADGKYDTAMTLLLFQFLLVILYSLAAKVHNYINQRFEITLDHYLQKLILAKSSSLPYHFMEDPEIHNHLQRIMGSSSASFLAPIRNAMGIGRSVLHSLSYMGFCLPFIGVWFSLPCCLRFSFFGCKSNWEPNRSKYIIVRHMPPERRDTYQAC